MDLQIEVKVMLPSGAGVELTAAQHDQILALVERVVLGKKKAETGNSRIFGARRWTADEDKKIKDRFEMANPDAEDNAPFILTLARELGRTPKAVYARYYKLTRALKAEIKLPEPAEKNPVASSNQIE